MNIFYFKILSNFLGALQERLSGGFRIFPLTTPLKRPKEGLRPFLWKPSWKVYGEFPEDGARPLRCALAGDGRTGDGRWEQGACSHSEVPALWETRVGMAWQFWHRHWAAIALDGECGLPRRFAPCCTEGMASADQTPLAFGASVMVPKILCSLSAHRILTTAAPFRSLLPPLAAL